ncbi:MAG: DNA-directed RNA polymerase subunit alpha [Chthonomonadales bacterium]|nr:DNA-directed RNA polymerase subunit alpha [Chthonomonadales bacterium]
MEIALPRIEKLEETESYGTFVVEPLERGYGVTLGNSLRRVMLSSIEGAAITSVKIEGVLHEFSEIPGLKEDTTELLLNLKNLNVKMEAVGGGQPEPQTIRIERTGAGRVTGADVECPPGVSVINQECYIATIDDENATLSMEMVVEVGKGYVLPDKQEQRPGQPIGVIPVGSAFTPVRKVNYTVEPRRVGFKTDFERLVLQITTNGSLKPSLAISRAAMILDRYFRHFMELAGAEEFAETDDLLLPEGPLTRQAGDERIEEMDFSVRTSNCLKKANILTLGELIQATEADLMHLKNFGKKSLDEVKAKLEMRGLALRGSGTSSPSKDSDADEEDIEDE